MTNLDKAAVLANEFVLTHKVNFDSVQGEQKGRAVFNRSWFPKPLPTVSTVSTRRSATASTPLEKVCFYCKNSGHFIADCPVLIKKQESSIYHLKHGRVSRLALHISLRIVLFLLIILQPSNLLRFGEKLGLSVFDFT